jgi:phenylacetate-CoA ligase
VAPYYQLIVERPGTMDELTVLCEPASAASDGDDLRGRIQRALRDATGLSMVIQLLAPGAVPRSEGKAVRVIDNRSR